ncbi:MAG: hypothetical protein ACYSUB_01740 [Planctomycetota bacterium]|jgi:hypothetical protein
MSKQVTVLKRFGHKGQFVKYPDKWPRRMLHTGKRRFETSCDLLVGICACGERHQENEEWIEDMLRNSNSRIETHEEWLTRSRKEADGVLVS